MKKTRTPGLCCAGQRVVELGAGMMPYGYALAACMPSEKFCRRGAILFGSSEAVHSSSLSSKRTSALSLEFLSRWSGEDMLVTWRMNRTIFFACLLVESKTASCREPITKKGRTGNRRARVKFFFYKFSQRPLPREP